MMVLSVKAQYLFAPGDTDLRNVWQASIIDTAHFSTFSTKEKNNLVKSVSS